MLKGTPHSEVPSLSPSLRLLDELAIVLGPEGLSDHLQERNYWVPDPGVPTSALPVGWLMVRARAGHHHTLVLTHSLVAVPSTVASSFLWWSLMTEQMEKASHWQRYRCHVQVRQCENLSLELVQSQGGPQVWEITHASPVGPIPMWHKWVCPRTSGWGILASLALVPT